MLDLTVDGPVAWLTLSRPAKRNALSPQLLRTLIAHCEAVEAHDDVRVLGLRAEGETFCAGADLLASLPELSGPDGEAAAELGRQAASALASLSVPTVAQVQGACVGGGVVLCSACDLVVAGASARFRVPELSLGVPFAWGGTTRLAALVGVRVAADWVLSGRWVAADEALDRGFVSRVVPDDALGDAVTELANAVAQAPRAVTRYTKQQLQRAAEGRPDDDADAVALVAALRDPESMAAAQRYLAAQVGTGR